eukprot:GEMP01063688.1.p1 GENE.GEMP01063688.1~~GEMP01063688.1.p1  ORF type:complete len:197 (+),score=37.36 GEMP01063688.1:129-719(+)
MKTFSIDFGMERKRVEQRWRISVDAQMPLDPSELELLSKSTVVQKFLHAFRARRAKGLYRADKSASQADSLLARTRASAPPDRVVTCTYLQPILQGSMNANDIMSRRCWLETTSQGLAVGSHFENWARMTAEQFAKHNIGVPSTSSVKNLMTPRGKLVPVKQTMGQTPSKPKAPRIRQTLGRFQQATKAAQALRNF